ncbi:VOC family protein [Halobacillus salinarum]|uniref:VOC family protein n=1 Tax=Halobacillus salinarum TaxID=2932257 RepID=A0ABY4EJN1_9BACI|nr:VOC family protein [Halobacillus salinarum]UOQ44374.1 VOC family protein [Halobacillus salinarum]
MLALDHIVVASQNPEEACASYARKTGFKTVEGGTHEKWGTYNHLCFFPNQSYVEWIGIIDEIKASHSENPLIQQLYEALAQNQQGLIQFALRTANMDAYVHEFQQQNIPYSGPYQGQRQKQDGELLKWQMLFPSVKSDSWTAPFLIEWEKDRIPEDKSAEVNQPLTELNIGVRSPEHSVPLFQDLYQLGPARTEKGEIGNPSFYWPLENAKLTMSIGEGLEANVNGMIL